jgi:hypothetical protein
MDRFRANDMSLNAESERGATALLVALVLLLLMGVAALALDLGAGWNERRQDQTAADLAAVAGALSIGDNDAIADAAMAVAKLNVDTQYANADWTALWTGCTDPDRPSGFTPINHSSLGTIDCISVNPSFLRVRLPDQVIETSFGKVVGVDTITTYAEAVVTMLPPGGGGALPFAIRSDSTAGEICVDTSTGSKIVPPCDGNESGSFGNIAPPLFGNEELNTSPSCGNQTSSNNYVPESIAMGIDHYLHTFSLSQWTATGWSPSDNSSKKSVDAVSNMDECNDTGGTVAEAADGTPINAVYVDTGNSVKADITEGLVTGKGFSDGGDALLTRSGDTRHVAGYDLDNQPLWQHLLADGATAENKKSVDYDDSGTWAPNSCNPAEFSGKSIEDKTAQMRTCLDDYEGSFNGQIFANSIEDSPRVGTAPRLWHDNLGSGLSFRPVKSYDIVYINTVHFDDKDATVFYPDDDDDSDITLKGKWKEVEQVTAFLLVDSMISETTHTGLGGLANDSWEPKIYE